MNKLNQNQAGPGMSTFELVLTESESDALTMDTAGDTHQSVTLATNDLVWCQGTTAAKNGPFYYDGTGFSRCVSQENLRVGARIVKGAEMLCELGTNATKRFAVTSSSGKDGHGQRVNIVASEIIVIADTSSSDNYYEHVQGSASATWVVTHNLNKKPSIVIIASSGDEVEGDITYDSSFQLTLTFSAAFSGTAYLN